jgi:hypothetical protein
VIAVETWSAEGVRHGRRLLVPIFRTLTVRLPGPAGGLVWNRPLAVEVQESGEERFLSVPDWTRRIQWILLGAGAAGILLRLAGRRREQRRRERRP